MRKLFFLIALLVLSILVLAEGTRTWEQSKFDDLEKGTAKGVAIRSDGGLELAPSFKPVYTTPSTYIWSIAGDAQGNVYAAAGAPARVYRVTPTGQTSIIFQPEELQVQALVVDASGAIYAATSPDGKVYKIVRGAAAAQPKTESNAGGAAQPSAKLPVEANYTSSVFFDPKTKYIWDLAEDPQGRIYVATGDQGEIFRVEKNGEHSLFFKSDEAHIRVLAFDTQGNLIAGSDGSGLVYRISPAGEAFVLYSAPKKEITALALDRAGNIYAAGVGEKRATTPASQGAQPMITPAPIINVTTGLSAGIMQAPPPQMNIPFPAAAATGGSEVYQIAPDGSPRRIWSSREDVVYSLIFDQRGQLLAGTGNKGRIYVIQDAGSFTDLVKASATQVTAMAQAPGGGVYAATSNLGKIFTLGATPDSDGTYESDVFDGRNFSRWGRAEVRGNGAFDVYARSGNVDNPDRNWSPWKRIDFARGGALEVPAARFVQWKAVLHPGKPNPAISSVVINYLPKNVAPVIEDVYVQTGARFQSVPKPSVENVTVGSSPIPRFDAPTPAVRDRDSVAVRWTTHDDNDDDLVFSIYYRGDNESHWKLLKDNITDRVYSFDAALLPDGGYTVKVVASDAPSHSPDEALSAAKESPRFEIDSTPPQVVNLNVALDNNALHITFRAIDGFSTIKRAEYSIDAGEWQYMEPVGHLSDYRVENYDFLAAVPGEPARSEVAAADTGGSKPGRRRVAGGGDGAAAAVVSQEHVVVVRVYDRFDNMGSAKFVVRGR